MIYSQVSVATTNHGQTLDGMLGKLNEFEKEVDHLEDVLMPAIDRLEHRDFGRQEIPEAEKQLKVPSCSLLIFFFFA